MAYRTCGMGVAYGIDGISDNAWGQGYTVPGANDVHFLRGVNN